MALLALFCGGSWRHQPHEALADHEMHDAGSNLIRTGLHSNITSSLLTLSMQLSYLHVSILLDVLTFETFPLWLAS